MIPCGYCGEDVTGGHDWLACVHALKLKLRDDDEPYCDVCGNAGKDLRSPVEVCRDCYDVARDPPPGCEPFKVLDVPEAQKIVTDCYETATRNTVDRIVAWLMTPEQAGRVHTHDLAKEIARRAWWPK